MAQGDIESGGGEIRDNDAVPLTLACRTVAKAASKLATGADTTEAEIKVISSRALSWLDISVCRIGVFF